MITRRPGWISIAVIAVLGAQLAALVAAAQARKEQPPSTINGRPSCGTRTTAGSMMTTATTMADLARNLSPMAGRPIMEKTGLTGTFDLDLTWTPDQHGPPPAAAPTPLRHEGRLKAASTYGFVRNVFVGGPP